ncbi:MAG: hypothetical protein KDA84_28835, partial [Planctomycetaceae bacterium]|nr:hypothetical protein [Planctomycetaceae bacterium]
QVQPEPKELPESKPQLEPPVDYCGKCGSDRIIPNVALGNQAQFSDGKLLIHVPTNPGVSVYGEGIVPIELRASICGDCGHVELAISNPSRLYDHFLQRMHSNEKLD